MWKAVAGRGGAAQEPYPALGIVVKFWKQKFSVCYRQVFVDICMAVSACN